MTLLRCRHVLLPGSARPIGYGQEGNGPVKLGAGGIRGRPRVSMSMARECWDGFQAAKALMDWTGKVAENSGVAHNREPKGPVQVQHRLGLADTWYTVERD